MNLFEVAISPCPNDTYAFETLFCNKELFPYRIEPHFYDIDRLNHFALESRFPIIKVSSALYPSVQNAYRYIRSGATFSFQEGPIVIGKQANISLTSDIEKLSLATPGLHTSAHTAFTLLYKKPRQIIQVPYNKIAQAVIDECDIGILIHEARTTFQREFPHKLFPLIDLQHAYYKKTGTFLPLGLILIRKDVPEFIAKKFETALSISITRAMQRAYPITDFIREHASSLSEKAIQDHIELYVQDETRYMSDASEKVLQKFFHFCSS